MTSNTAPGDLESLRLFVNTLNVEEGTDAVSSPSGLGGWLTEHGLLPEGGRVTAGDVAKAGAVREAFRSLLLANNGDPADTDGAVHVLNDAAASARFSLIFSSDSHSVSEPHAPGVNGALGRLLSIASRAMADGTWSRLKACAADDCRWAFFDNARNRSGRWCDMAVCGNRVKARTYRARHA